MSLRSTEREGFDFRVHRLPEREPASMEWSLRDDTQTAAAPIASPSDKKRQKKITIIGTGLVPLEPPPEPEATRSRRREIHSTLRYGNPCGMFRLLTGIIPVRVLDDCFSCAVTVTASCREKEQALYAGFVPSRSEGTRNDEKVLKGGNRYGRQGSTLKD